jgi:hypothetical protein
MFAATARDGESAEWAGHQSGVYAELSMAFARIEELEAVLADGGFEIQDLPREALFLAGKVSLEYRRRSRTAVKCKRWRISMVTAGSRTD